MKIFWAYGIHIPANVKWGYDIDVVTVCDKYGSTDNAILKQYWENDKSAAAVIKSLRQILIKNYAPFTAIFHIFTRFLTAYCFFPTVFNILHFFRSHVYYFVNCS